MYDNVLITGLHRTSKHLNLKLWSLWNSRFCLDFPLEVWTVKFTLNVASAPALKPSAKLTFSLAWLSGLSEPLALQTY